MDLRKQLFTKNECYIIGKKIKPKGVFWHSTGANNPYLKRYVQPDDGLLGKNIYGNSWNNFRPSGRKVCCHAFIGKLENGSIATYQTLPWDMRGWHAGSGRNGSANNDYIGFEICEDNTRNKDYAMAVYKEAVELSAYLCEMYKLDPLGKNVIIDHAEGARLGIASNHGDVRHWLGKYGITLDKMRKDIAAEMKIKPEPDKGDDVTDTLYRVQVGAFRVRSNAEDYADQIRKAGFDAYVTTAKAVAPDKPVPKPVIKKGDLVKVKQGTKTYTGGNLSSWVYGETFTVLETPRGDRVVIGQRGQVTAAVHDRDLIKQ